MNARRAVVASIAPCSLAQDFYPVVKTVDGDTFDVLIAGDIERVRPTRLRISDQRVARLII